MSLVKRLWNDEAGFIVSAELILVSTIAVLGLIVGLTSVRDAITSELSDVAGAFQDVVQTYAYNGITGHSAAVSGSDYQDALDYCDGNDDGPNSDDNCIVHTNTIGGEEGTTVTAPVAGDSVN